MRKLNTITCRACRGFKVRPYVKRASQEDKRRGINSVKVNGHPYRRCPNCDGTGKLRVAA